ncbi:ATP-binding protein [Streptomyces albidoflavus]|uniref:ATP-binding protein n=1 Tax=Streptomyces albidoflavus TaxID=1886 RepID=UPI0033CC56E3
MSRGSSPEGTGGAGTFYECRIAAFELGALVCRIPVEGLEGPPSEIRLQQGDTGFPLDDVIAVDRSGPFPFVVEKQVKRTLKIAPSEEAWRKTIGQCLRSLRQHGLEIDARRRLLGVVATGPVRDLEELTKLARAADRPCLDDFRAELAVAGRRGEPYHRMWRHLTTTVLQLMTAPDGAGPAVEVVEETAFRIARRLVVQIEPEKGGATYRSLLGLMEATVVDTQRGPGGADIFRRLTDIAKEYGPQGGVIDVQMLRDLLHTGGAVLRADPPAQPELEAIGRWTERFLGSSHVGHQLGGRLHLKREQQVKALQNAVRAHERVLLTGPAGVGKSALARDLAGTTHTSGGTVLALSLTERTWHTVADIGHEVGARLERTLAAAPGGERLLLLDGAEQVLTDDGALLSSVMEVLPRAEGGRWRVLAVAREQAADAVQRVLGDTDGGEVHRLQNQLLDDDEVRSVLVAFPKLRRLVRSPRSARLLRNLFVVEQLVRATGDARPRQVLGEEDVADWVYEGLVRSGDVRRPGRGGPDERNDVYLAMADAVIAGHAWAGLRGLSGAAREGLVGDGILVREGAEFTFAHDVHQDYAIAVRLGMSDAPDVAGVAGPRRLLRGFRLWAQMLLARTARRAPARLPAVWQDITARAHGVAGVGDVRWADVPYEALFELGEGRAVLSALAAGLLDDGGVALVAAASRRLPDAEAAVPVLDFLLAQADALAPRAADGALVCTATWLLALGASTPKDLVARVPGAVACWYDGGPRRAQEAACALACAADRLDDNARGLLADIAFRHPLSGQCVVEDQRLSLPLACHEPALLARLAKAFYLGHPHSQGHVDAREGVRELGWPLVSRVVRDFLQRGPDPADLGPFSVLVEYAPDHGLALIGSVADAATAAVMRRDDARSARPVSVTWPLAGSLRTYAGTDRVWEWPWAGEAGPGPAIAALAALRRWAGARAGAGVPLAEIVDQVLGCGESLALVAVVVDMLCQQAARLETELDPALEQLAIWLYPMTSSALISAVPVVVLRAGRERQDAYRLLGQRLLAEHAVHLPPQPQPQPQPLAPGIEERQRTRDHIAKTIAALLDSTQYQQVNLPDGRGRTLVNHAVQQIRARDEAVEGDLYRFVERFALAEEVCRARDETEAVDVQRLFERMAALEAALEVSPPTEGPGKLEDIQAAVAAVLVQSAAREDGMEPWQLHWAGEQLMAAAANTPAAITSPDLVCEEQNHKAGDRSAAHVLPILLADDDLRRRTKLTAQDAATAAAWMAASGFIEARNSLATALTNQWAHTPCSGPGDRLHTEGLAALTTMVATAGMHPPDETGNRQAYQLTNPAPTLRTSTTAILDLRLAAPAVSALHHAARTDCVHRAEAVVLLEALTAHDRRTWTKQSGGMAGHARPWRLAHDTISAEQALVGDRRRLEETVAAFSNEPDAVVDLLLSLARQATTPAQITELLTLWPNLLGRFLTPGLRCSGHLREALLPAPADGIRWPARPTWAIITTWAKAHTGATARADHLIRVLDQHDLFTGATVALVLDVLGTDPAPVTYLSRSAVPFLQRVLNNPTVRTEPSGQRAHRLLDELAATANAEALRAQRALEEAPTFD